MPASKAQQRAVSKYMKENYDEIKVRMEKGQKNTIKAHAEARGESVNGFVNRAIAETMERDNGAPAGPNKEE
ncbi:ABC transporter ATP-binding protein [Flintibacter sp. HCN-6482]|uniref:ABC transporter ATP-binding protein n=1 Tax=Flintibacter sp. HCN-6482 TaxID=3134672 RepID=UPI0030C5F8F6